ncbi:MAG: DNA-binding protein [Kingella sp. (in: b-proteobacteria)]|nr:MAG: DNA-binding protein [Kingella sp. (in: b-proteobacteria)]
MSSREVAELCGKRHDHVLRDIDNLNATYAEMGFPKIGESRYISELNGVEYRECLLTHEQCIDLITGYRADVRIRINRRWLELEQAAQPKIPQTLPDALRLAADLAERNQQQAAQIAELTPKAEAMTRIEAAQGDITVTQAAKMLKIPPKQLFDWLAQHGWLYRSGGSGVWLGYQDKVRSGCVTHSVHRYESRSTGEQRIATQVYLTPKGMGKIAEKLGA